METTNISKLKRTKMLETINEIKKNITDEKTLENISLIENELNKNKYGLIWEEHKERVDEELETQVPTFEEIDEKKIIKVTDEPYNFLLEGDNLHSLYLLEKTHLGKIDFIYIDPPYNTHNREFVYNDKIVGQDDSYRHSKWLSFIEKRLCISKNILSKSGVIFISIDQNEFAQLKLLCDNIFGEENFIGNFIWRKKYGGGQTDEFFVTEHEYIFGYRKSNAYNWCDEYKDINDNEFKYEDDKGKFSITKLEKWGSSSHREDRPTMYFSIKDPDDNDFYPIAPDGMQGRWRVGKERLNNLIVTNCIYWKNDVKNGRWIPYEKNYLFNSKEKLIKSRSILYNIAETGTATKLLTNIFGKKDVFNNPKPIELIKFLIKHNKSNIVLDFFAGSGTTGQAVLELNKEDNGNRKFILCTNNENNICEEITYKRIEKVINGYGDVENIPANLKYFKTSYVPRMNNEEVNLHFNLLINIKNLIQLENGIEIDDKKIQVFLEEHELDKFSKNNEKLDICEKIYISSDILITSYQEEIFKDNNIDVYIIPEYYFEEEIMEVM